MEIMSHDDGTENLTSNAETLNITGHTCQINCIDRLGNIPENWLAALGELEQIENVPKKTKLLQHFFARSTMNLDPNDLRQNKYYAMLLAKKALFRGETDPNVGRQSFQKSLAVCGKMPFLYIAYAQFEVAQGHIEQAVEILRQGEEICQNPEEIVSARKKLGNGSGNVYATTTTRVQAPLQNITNNMELQPSQERTTSKEEKFSRKPTIHDEPDCAIPSDPPHNPHKNVTHSRLPDKPAAVGVSAAPPTLPAHSLPPSTPVLKNGKPRPILSAVTPKTSTVFNDLTLDLKSPASPQLSMISAKKWRAPVTSSLASDEPIPLYPPASTTKLETNKNMKERNRPSLSQSERKNPASSGPKRVTFAGPRRVLPGTKKEHDDSDSDDDIRPLQKSPDDIKPETEGLHTVPEAAFEVLGQDAQTGTTSGVKHESREKENHPPPARTLLGNLDPAPSGRMRKPSDDSPSVPCAPSVPHATTVTPDTIRDAPVHHGHASSNVPSVPCATSSVLHTIRDASAHHYHVSSNTPSVPTASSVPYATTTQQPIGDASAHSTHSSNVPTWHQHAPGHGPSRTHMGSSQPLHITPHPVPHSTHSHQQRLNGGYAHHPPSSHASTPYHTPDSFYHNQYYPPPPQAPNPAVCPNPACSSMHDKKILQINRTNYVLLKVVGKGGSSKVYQALNPATCEIVAVKQVNLVGCESSVLEGYKNEIKFLQKLQGSEYIVKLIDYEICKKNLYLVMECGSIDMSAYFKKLRSENKKIERISILVYWAYMLKAVDTIHKHGVIHLDLKPANFMFVDWTLKLIDFGIANAIQVDATSIIKDTQVGTLNYMAPETINDMSGGAQTNGMYAPKFKVGPKADVWSLGCILYYMMYGRTPFQHIQHQTMKLFAITNEKHRIEFPDFPCKELVDIVQACLIRDPKMRPSVEMLLNHPLLK